MQSRFLRPDAVAFASLLAHAASCLAAPAAPTTVSRLRCENTASPLGVEATRPRLSWATSSPERGWRQAAYQVLGASSEARLRAGRGDLWDSGGVRPSQSAEVLYAGKLLNSRARCVWAVRVWGAVGGPTAYSKPASWEMGLLHKSDWRGKWIGYAAPKPAAPKDDIPTLKAASWIWFPEGNPLQDAPAATRWFRRGVAIAPGRAIAGAKLRVAADNLAVVWVNGQQVGRIHDGWQKNEAFDVAKYLQVGENTVAIAVTNEPNPNANPAGLAAQLEVRFAEGEPLSVVTDAAWKASNAAPEGWQQRAFNDAAWKPAQVLVKVGEGPWGKIGGDVADIAPPAPHLRREFALRGKLKRATAYVCGLGYHELSINGKKVGDHVLDPGWTRYDKRSLYVAHDVTKYLQPGRNALGVILGTGHFDDHVLAVWNFDKAPWRARPKLNLELRLDYEDGSSESVSSDGAWKASTGPVLFDSISAGENYDARLEIPGWNTPGFNDAAWKPVELVAAPGGDIVAQVAPPIRVTQVLAPVKVTQPKPGVWIFDLGQNFAGVPQLRVSGPRGAKVTMRCAEKIRADGTLDASNIEYFVKGRDANMQYQTDSYVLKGGGREVWSPRFTYHGFQYVEVTGLPGSATPDNIRGLVMHSDFKDVGGFTCSNPLLNTIQRLTEWAYRSNFHSVPTDCPHREKNGWMGDAHLAAEFGLLNYDATANYEKWLDDIHDAQRPDGVLPGIVPTGGWGFSWGNGPAWDSAYPIIAWELYQFSGDRAVLAKHFAGLKKYVDYVGTRGKDGTKVVGFGLDDWVAPKTKTPLEVTDTGYYYADALIVARAAKVLGRDAEASKYLALAQQIKRDFNAKFIDSATGQVANGSLTAQSCALYQGLVEEKDVPKVVERLVSEVEAQGFHMDVGILGAKYLLRALSDNGRADVAYKIATQTTAPSYGDWVKRGATTLWEDWPGGASRNHIMFGDVSAWFTQYLAGIRAVSPAFERIQIKPHVVGDLKSASAHYDSVRGRIESRWKISNGALQLDVAVPANATATVFVPSVGAAKVKAPGGAAFVRREKGYEVFTVGAGRYTFR